MRRRFERPPRIAAAGLQRTRPLLRGLGHELSTRKGKARFLGGLGSRCTEPDSRSFKPLKP